MAVAASQIELINDDPRCEPVAGVLSEVREFVKISKEWKGLLTVGQAARILQVSTGQMSVWCARQRIKSKVIAGVKMVSAGEVVALQRERASEAPAKGGRGIKAASLADMVEAAWEDIDPLGFK